MRLLNGALDIAEEFGKVEHDYFLPVRLTGFDARRRTGRIAWEQHALRPAADFRQGAVTFARAGGGSFRGPYYGDESLPFALSFPSPRTIRLRMSARAPVLPDDRGSLMLAGPVRDGPAWTVRRDGGTWTWSSGEASVAVALDPFRVEVRDGRGRLLTRTRGLADTGCFMNADPVPFQFVRSAESHRRHVAASFAIAPDEGFYGCGESFTRLNKRGQRVVLWTNDAQGVQTGRMYKPVPFFLSSRGYGMFVHSSAPLSFDFGKTYDETAVLYSGDDALDLFVFVGDPKQALTDYTALTGRSPMPPAWTFGLWMSRITYKSQRETEAVARKLRRHRIPCDVLHLDTGWFEQDWRCDYRFSPTRFPDPRGMIRRLKRRGLRVCLWQLPYFTHDNALYAEIVRKGLAVRDIEGGEETQEAALDFSNPRAVRWYQDRLAGLLRQGVAAIKVDFGEAAPLEGRYASGRTGFHEHNLYPLRYNRAAAEITKRVTGNGFIWARATWAGSQRYPLHWGGDAENTDSAMAATLRGGLSLGLTGFTFWSHDIGGFVKRPEPDLYLRWLAFGMLTSHSRCHGAPPREPWEFGKAFLDRFRTAVELKYRLLPYILKEARAASALGHPLLRPLFFEFPDDPGSWLVEDAYLLGRDLLVAPLFSPDRTRRVYLPPGRWTELGAARSLEGGGWHRLAVGEIPAVVLVRGGAHLPMAEPALSTEDMDLE